MNKSSLFSAFVLFASLVPFPFLNTVHAMGSKDVIDNQLAGQKPYIWYDGGQKRTVWLNPQLVAELTPGPESQRALKKAYSSAEEILSKHGSIRIWKLSNNVAAKTAIRSLKSSRTNHQYSPVLHDGPTSSGRMRALPGNIIVHLDPSWERDVVKLWLDDNNLELVKKLNIGQNIFVIKADPGLASLELANKLYNSGKVVAAYPDWWKEVVRR